MIVVVVILALVALVVAPQLWVKRVLSEHHDERADFPGTGGELATHLLAHYGIEAGVERTDGGDHYDPEAKVVRLSEKVHDGRSVSAVAVAAHEVGHAIQDHAGERGLKLRGRMVRVAQVTDKFAAVFFLLSPFLGLVARSPAAFLALAALGIGFLAVRVLVHLVTLPVEYDASFAKALPILEGGGYLDEADLPGARKVLKAAALTYVAAAMMSLVDLARWVRILF